MKKIVLGLTIIACAAFANAAQVGWSFVCSDDLDGLTVYAFTSALDAPTADSIKAANSSGLIEAGRRETIAQGAITGITGNSGDSATVYFYVLSADEKSFYSSTASGTIQDDTASTSYSAAFSNPSLTTANFSPIGNVPEPTSALLMLLGVAGLALKRKRV